MGRRCLGKSRLSWQMSVRTVSGAILMVFCAIACSAMTIRSKSDMRLWETVADRSAPLSWPWEEGADSATIVFSNCVTRAVSSVSVQRGAGEARGSCAQPAQQGGEGLFGVTLVQRCGDAEISRDSASLAYVSGAGGGPITVRATGTREWKRLLEPRVYAFDPAWLGETGESGYAIAWPEFSGLRIIMR